MMKAVATAVEAAERAPGQAPVQPLYLEALTLVERLHRRLLDVIKDEFDRRGRAEINSMSFLRKVSFYFRNLCIYLFFIRKKIVY